ncbi:IS1595 family transposase [Paenibacillus qinlingensis]|uniref:Transposase-like protein n=1 Tax=Paenibacillus qinlingensis TaxID=1837343 RepID=A0ABU1P4B0_9BACL|nr:IS1595 family transposase [Paenibacillus qinlingensis]MDR6554576.1 transposase-like protein [Paenibacillus qinlingensis]
MDIQLIGSLNNAFQSEEDCESFIIKSRWANGFFCPRCDHDSFYKIKTRNLLECKECRTQISITAGTIMHKSKLPLLIWFKAIRILIQDEMTYSIPVFASLLRVNYRTAKLILEKLKLALHKQYARMGKQKLVKPIEDSIEVESEQHRLVTDRAKPNKGTSVFDKFLFKNSRNVRLANADMFAKWMHACFSVYLYPYFLRYFQVD